VRVARAALVVIGLTAQASAGSFRGGSLSWWIPDPVGDPRAVELTVMTTWDDPSTDVTSVTLDFGDGTTATIDPPVIYSGTTTVSAQAFTFRYVTTTHAYASDGPFVVAATGCCRHPSENNADPTTPFRLASGVHLGVDRGSPPVGAVDPQLLAGIQFGGLYSVTAPYGDASVRMSSKAESGVDVPIVVETMTSPTVTYYAATGIGAPLVQVVWDLRGIASDRTFELSIVAEGSDPTIFSMIDFVAETNAASAAAECGAGLGRITVAPGELVSVPVHCSVVGARLGRVLPLGSVVDTSAFQWTPDVADLGKHELGLVHVLAPPDPITGSFGFAIDVEPTSDDDCVAHPGICDPSALCKITPDGYRCQCPDHYMGDGRTCEFVPYCYIDMQMKCENSGLMSSPTCCASAPDMITCSCGNTGGGGGGEDPVDNSGGGCGVATQAGWLVALILVLVRFRRPRRWVDPFAIAREARIPRDRRLV